MAHTWYSWTADPQKNVGQEDEKGGRKDPRETAGAREHKKRRENSLPHLEHV